jgi:hypothetical protein
MDLLGSVILTNTSGIGFRDAVIRVVAGEVNVQQPILARAEMAMQEAAKSIPAQEVVDRRLYDVGRMTLRDRETKQVALLTASGIPVHKEYRFESLVNAYGGGGDVGPVSAALVLAFDNEESFGLGSALPSGPVRVYRVGGQQPALFVGEDRIRDTPKGERIELQIGVAFDVTATARRIAFERISDNAYETAQEIILRNTKNQPVEVKVVGSLPPGWRMLEESVSHTRESAERIVWTLPVPARGETALSYRVRITQ